MVSPIIIYTVVFIILFTGVFFLLSFLESRREKIPKLPRILPKITIAVPAYNEEKTIGGTIESLLKLKYPRNKLQLMVIDDGSTDNTYKVAKEYESKGVRVITKANGGKGSALNLALEHAEGEFFGGLDADSYASPNAVRRLIPYFEDDRVMAVTPSLKVWKAHSPLEKLQQMEYIAGVFLRKTFAFLDAIHVTPGPLTLYRKEFFDKYGGYDENNITEDIEIALRIVKNGFTIQNAIDADVFTVVPTKFWGLFRQRIRWYLGFVENVIHYKELFNAKKHGILAYYVLPMAFISIVIPIGFLLYAIVNVVKGGIVTLIRGIDSSVVTYDSVISFLKYAYTPGLNQNTPMLIAGTSVGLLMLYLARKHSPDDSKVFFGYLLYWMFYWFIFAFWWLCTFLYKVFGGKMRFGGVEWNNSLLTKAMSKLKARVHDV